MLGIIHNLFWLLVTFGFHLKVTFIPGKCNILSDLISRLHSVQLALKLQLYLAEEINQIDCATHMTEKSFTLLQESWERMTCLDS
jgi:hypothetical protein